MARKRRLVAALELIVNRAGRDNNCTAFVGSQVCRSRHSGRSRDARYGVDQWCESCVAADALGLPLPTRKVG